MALFAIPQCAFALLVLVVGGTGGLYLATAGALAIDVLLHLLPWRVPRDDRSVAGYWVEALAYMVPLSAMAAAWLLADPGRASAHLPHPAWFALSPLVAAALVQVSGLNLAAVRSGALAFMAGPLPPHRAAARALATVVAPLFEEVLYRGVPAALAGGLAAPLGLAAGGAAFVARHHLIKGSEERMNWPTFRHELAGAVLLAGLVVASGSVWPAVLAHLLGNLPQVVLEVQRAREPSDDSDESEMV